MTPQSLIILHPSLRHDPSPLAARSESCGWRLTDESTTARKRPTNALGVRPLRVFVLALWHWSEWLGRSIVFDPEISIDRPSQGRSSGLGSSSPTAANEHTHKDAHLPPFFIHAPQNTHRGVLSTPPPRNHDADRRAGLPQAQVSGLGRSIVCSISLSLCCRLWVSEQALLTCPCHELAPPSRAPDWVGPVSMPIDLKRPVDRPCGRFTPPTLRPESLKPSIHD